MNRPLRVLVVDDNTDQRESLRLLLGLWGYAVHEAGDGCTALGRAARFQPDVVLLDLGMPGLDGLEVARQLRELPGLGLARLIALTGYADEQTRVACREAGFLLHLVKPFDAFELEALLRQFVPPSDEAHAQTVSAVNQQAAGE